MAGGGKYADDLHFRADAGIGDVDDPQRRLTALDEHKRAAHIFRPREAGLERGPDAEIGQRFFGVDAGRNMVGIAHREASVRAQQALPIEPAIDPQRADRAVRRGDEGKCIAQYVASRVRREEVLLSEIVHPFGVSGEEHLSRRAGLDLAGKRRRGGEGRDHSLARFGCVGGVYGAQGVSEAGGSEYGDLVSRRHREG